MHHVFAELRVVVCASLRLVVSNERSGRNVRRRISLTNRKFVARDQGLRHFRIR
jgi:hypothetical protein